MRIGVTGHRPKDLPGGYNWDHPDNVAIILWLKSKLVELGSSKAPAEEALMQDQFASHLRACTGMALGVDQFFAQACIEEGVPFTAFIPCHGQESRWPASSKLTYEELLADRHCLRTRYTHDGPYPGPWCMVQRNQDMVDWLVEESSPGGVLLAVWSGKRKGGTFDCVVRGQKKRYGLERVLRVIQFNPVTREEREL
jgi:hypothetical protein